MTSRSESPTISITNIAPKASPLLRFGIWLMDYAMGLAKMDSLYRSHKMQGLSKEAFADKLVELLALELNGIAELQKKIPKKGPVLIASNHPFGGIEGVILARAISEVRPDLKVLANHGLAVFQELRDYFIFTDPLRRNNPKNSASLRECIHHIDAEKALLLFPAGRVSHFNQDSQQIIENKWDKLVAKLATRDNCQFVPVFVDGRNSNLFYKVEKVYFKMRMFLLGRELLNKHGQTVRISSAHPVGANTFPSSSYEQNAVLCRALSYTQDPRWSYKWPADKVRSYKKLHEAVAPQFLENEMAMLPKQQLLFTYKNFEVYFAYQVQVPSVITEIARLRELVFRQHNEGSGEEVDSDHFDDSYTHLFVYNKKDRQIIGAYRMGQSDRLIAKSGLDGLYLNKMFDFDENFINRQHACLEMGRSFLIPKYQTSYQGLLLLWRGIGAFVKKHPQYRHLYGTVSISKLYSPKSVKLISQILIDEKSEQFVKPKNAFEFKAHPEIESYIDLLKGAHSSKKEQLKALSCFLRALEPDGKDLPILAKHYLKIGADFHALGIDHSFNFTPGLLLSVNLPKAPEKLLKLYLGEDWQQYRDWQA